MLELVGRSFVARPERALKQPLAHHRTEAERYRDLDVVDAVLASSEVLRRDHVLVVILEAVLEVCL